MSPRKLIAEFVRKGIASVTLVSRNGQKKFGAKAAMFCLTLLAGTSAIPNAQAATMERLTPAECVFHFVADGGLNDVTRIKDEAGNVLYSPSAFGSAVDVVTATLGAPNAPLAEQAQKWDAIRMRQIAIYEKFMDLPRNSDEYRRLKTQHDDLNPALAAARADLDKTVRPLAERVLAECDATLKAMPATVAEKDLDQTKLDAWFDRNSKTTKDEIVRIGRELDFSGLEISSTPPKPM